MNILNKIKWILGISVVFILILATNLIDRNNFKKMKFAVESLYEDRLVAKGLLFDISNYLHEKESAFLRRDTVFFNEKNAAVNESIDDLINKFSNTRLTDAEKKTLDMLFSNFDRLKSMGNDMESILANEDEKWIQQLDRVKENINTLAKIQIAEGEKKLFKGRKAMDVMDLFSTIEIYFLIFLALAVQFIVFYSLPEKKNKSDNIDDNHG
jgi:hypothetical protein